MSFFHVFIKKNKKMNVTKDLSQKSISRSVNRQQSQDLHIYKMQKYIKLLKTFFHKLGKRRIDKISQMMLNHKERKSFLRIFDWFL